MKRVAFLLLATVMCGCASSRPLSYTWREKVEMDLKAMGEQNWIVIAESAYPYVRDEAYHTVTTDEDVLYLTKFILGEIADTDHVSPVVYREQELDRLQERDAPGVDVFREKLAKLLHQSDVRVKLRDDIEKMVKASAGTQRVLVLKGNSVMPYGTVYLQLVSGYWDENREKRLREAIKMAR